MKAALNTGLSFGLTSGVITTLGLIVGLYAGTHSKMVVVGGVLTIAIADAFSDALGIHVSQEAEKEHSRREVWGATIATFFSKLIFALTFLTPILLLESNLVVWVSIIWGFLLLSILSYVIGKERKENPWKIISEHMIIGLVVVVVSHLVGNWIATAFR